MTDGTVIIMEDGSRWRPSSSSDRIKCDSCDNEVDTPAEVASYPSGLCPQCNNPWTGAETRHTNIYVTAPESMAGEA